MRIKSLVFFSNKNFHRCLSFLDFAKEINNTMLEKGRYGREKIYFDQLFVDYDGDYEEMAESFECMQDFKECVTKHKKSAEALPLWRVYPEGWTSQYADKKETYTYLGKELGYINIVFVDNMKELRQFIDEEKSKENSHFLEIARDQFDMIISNSKSDYGLIDYVSFGDLRKRIDLPEKDLIKELRISKEEYSQYVENDDSCPASVKIVAYYLMQNIEKSWGIWTSWVKKS